MMEKQDDVSSREIQMALLLRRYPKLREMLHENETLLAASERRPLRVTGLFCVVIGTIFAVQIAGYYLLSGPLWVLPVLVICVTCVWAGVWMAFLTKNEYVFVTDDRIVHWKVNIIGRRSNKVYTVLLSEIDGVRLYRSALMWQKFLGKAGESGGDILVKKKSGGTYLVPSLREGVDVSESLMAEVARFRARKGVGKTD